MSNPSKRICTRSQTALAAAIAASAEPGSSRETAIDLTTSDVNREVVAVVNTFLATREEELVAIVDTILAVLDTEFPVSSVLSSSSSNHSAEETPNDALEVELEQLIEAGHTSEDWTNLFEGNPEIIIFPTMMITYDTDSDSETTELITTDSEGVVSDSEEGETLGSQDTYSELEGSQETYD